MANQRRKPRELMLTLLFTFLMFSAVFSSDSQKLLGICNYESSTDFCTINSSLLGKRPLQINGVGYIGSPVDQTVVMKYQLGSTSMATPGPAVTRDFAFKSDMSRGVLYYEAPSVSDLIGTTLGSKMSSFESEFYVQGPLINGDSALYSCDTSSKCTIKYSMARTPQINRIYPSIVYPTQKICFNVFTDYAAAESKLYYVSSKMGDYSMSFGMFDVYNQAEFNTWKDYQICAQASAAPAASSYDISVVSQDGAYLLTNFAKSYDGTTPYIVRMIPEIVSVSTNTLYKAGGGILTITGQGFDLKPSNNVVTVDDVSCTVFESTDSQIRCVLAEKTTTTTATLFVGGTGARVKEYYNVRKADLTDSAQPTRTSYFTDIDSRRNDDDNDPQYTRVVEAWFVPPQTGGYIFFASCDDSCVIELSNTDMDKSAKSTILSVGYNSWRNFWSPSPSSFYSAEQTLTAGKHYYMKVTHEEISGDDYVTVGVKINDSSTSKPTSFKGWKSIAIEPHHTFEKYEVLLPNNTSANFRLQFVNAGLKCAALTKSADIFQCTSSVCPCVSASFKATATEAQFLSTISSFFNSVKSYYGSTMTVTKETLDSSGAVTAIAADIANYKFTFVARYVLSSESSTATTIWSDATGVTATVTKTQSSTLPLSGKYVIKIPLSDSTIVTTDDISLDTYNGQITRLIYNVAPEYIGRIELKVVTSKYLSSNEGKELYYRIDQSPSVNLQIASSTTTPLTGGSITDPIEYPSTQAVAASNTPYYEAIPGTMVRSVETKPQISITTNGLLGACPLPSICDVIFIADVGQITSRTATTPYTQMTFSGTSIPNTELTYVSVGTIRRCDLDPSTPATSTSLKCLIGNMIAGSHSIVVQSKKGAIKNSSTLTNLEVNIVITSASPSTLSTSGGQVLTITGQFFPVSLTEANSFSDFAVTFTGGSKCYVTSVSSTSIVCTTPKSLPSSAKVTVAFNGKSTEYATAFTVTQSSQQVVSVDKPTICPVLKQDIVITVSSTPSSNPNDYTGIISNDKRSIYMRINKVDTTAKTLTARFPGSPTNDDYTVFVEYNGDRYQSSVTVSARSTITAIQVTTPGSSKTSISTTGGDTITITGTGFSTTLVDNQVVLGESTYAEIVSATSTQLVVRAGSYATPGSTEVKVFLKLSVESVCAVSGGCTLIYDSSQAPTLTSPNDVLMPVNGVVTISGSGFGSNAVGYIGSYAQQTISSTSTEIKISLTKMDNNEAFKLVVKTDTVYLPTVTVQTPLSPVLTSISPQSGSIGGEKITLSTIGIGMAVNSNFNVFYTSSGTTISVCDTITLVDSSTITCVTKKNVSVPSTTLTLSFTHKSSVSGSTSTVTLSCSTASNCAYQTTSSATPTISSLSQINSGTGLQTTISNFVFDSSYTIIMYYGGLAASTTTIASSVVSGTFSNGLPPGVVQVSVSFEKNNRLTFTSGYQQTISLSATINSPVTCSWAGGCTVAISQNSIKQGASAGDISVKVCGQTASLDLTGSTTNTLNAIVPVYATTHSLDLYKVQSSSVIKGTVTSVPANVGLLAFDGITTTMYASYTSDNCYVQVMFDSGKVGRLTSLKYYMNRMTDKQTNFVGKLKFQSSSDGTTWSDVFTADTYLREGWNTYSPTNALEFQYYRFFSATKGACQIGEIQIIGNIVEMTTATTKVCDVVVTAPGGQTQTFASQVTYSDAASSVVTSISPRYGTYKGGETVTFTGSGFSSTSSQISITIDGIACAITSSTSTQVQCTSGARPTVNSSPSTVLKFTGPAQNGYASMQSLSYKYANYWSDLDTWSGEYLPKDGDSVYIPVGQTLVVDSDSSPILKAVLIEGALIFAPNANPNHQRTFDAEYIYVSTNALLEIGTETSRYTSKLTITMHGTKESAQLPMYGNKGIFVRQGTLDIHGVQRTYTWTELATTVDVGKNQITLNAKTDWSVGEEIVVAPTDFDRNHAEAFKITAVDNSGTNTVLTLNTTTVYKHYSGSTTFTANNLNGTPMTKTLEMRAEVGLLTRNVVYKGADDDSVARQYGAHIMLHSPGDNSLTGRISYIEIKQAGQAFQLGRYPIHFHMIGRVDNSYVKGNAIHHTYNRACTIHGVHYLTLESNVAYETMGHTFFVEDAVETKNLLKNNLVVKTKISWSLLNSDQTPASFWITHPDNMLIGNHAAGSDKYGFWFDPQPHPTGPSYTENTCPEYEQLGEFTGNVAHSNGRYGLRIFHRLTPVTNPCKALAGGAYLNKEQPDPTVNVPIVTHFRDFVSYKNMRTAIMVEEGGALKFHNIRAADNVFSGVEMGKMAVGPWLTSSDDYHLQDALIVGASENYETESQYPGVDDETSSDTSTTCGVKGARSEKFRVKDVLFANFADPTWAAIATCSHCDGCDTDSSSRTYFFKNLFFYNVTRRVGFDTPFKEIIYDEDGSLGNSTHRWVVHYFSHLDIPECIRNEAVYNGLLCSKDISIRRFAFHHPIPDNALKGQPIKILNLRKIPAARRQLVDVSPSTCPSASSTLATFTQWDTSSFTTQQSLLKLYDQYNTAYNTYKTNLNLAESTNSQSAAQTAATAKTTMDAISPQITPLESQLEPSKGLYDNLYKTDVNFCNTNNYQNIDFRPKANPLKNLVFPIATGYEYHVHLSNGQDFNLLNGQYSQKELLDSEDRAIILHFNHTERAEAFWYNYTDSTANKMVTVTPQTSQISLTDTSVKIGDFYMNNVTRHMMMKFDGLNSDRNIFTLERVECISVGGCNNKNMPEDTTIETEYRYWSKPASWATTSTATGVLPKEGEDVIIQSTWNMVLDLTDTPVFRSIEINGRLTILNDGKTYNLHSYLIYVRKGELIVGTSDKPITGKVIFTLHGTRADKDIYFTDKMFEAGNKVIANTGLLNMYGKHVTTKWTRLAQTAPKGQNWILLVDDPTDWAVGDELGITPSGRDYTQRDFCVVQAINGKNVTLAVPLVYTHYGAAAIDATKTGTIDIRAEVLHLTRNIVVQGTNEDRWGAHVVTAHNNDSGFSNGQLVSVQRKGFAIIDHVEFVNCSQYDTDKAAVRFSNFFALSSTDKQSSVSNSAVHNGLGIGVMVTSANNVLVDNNVVFYHHIGGIWMKNSNSTTITNNVVGGMDTRYWSAETRLDELAGFNLCNKDQNCQNLIVKNNIVGGIQRIGFAMPTTSCTESSPSYENNLAHSCEHGAWIYKNNLLKNCEAFRNFKVYKTIEQGVLAYQGYNEIEATGIETLDCGRGIMLNIGAPFDINKFRLKDSVFWGQTDLLPADTGSLCVEDYAIYLSSATMDGKLIPEIKLSRLPYEKLKSFANYFIEFRASNIKFKNWNSGFRSCDSTKYHRLFGINQFNADNTPVHIFDQVEFVNVNNDAVAYLYTPPAEWAIIKDCGQFVCTGPLNTILKFSNAKASGSPVPNIPDITTSLITFQIIPNNVGASEYVNSCNSVTSWNAYLCKNQNVAQLVIDSLDSDSETRLISPINILSQSSKFNSTLNSFMDHATDAHYTSLHRLSRFPSIVQTNQFYEIRFTGTQPGSTKYAIAGGETGVDWLHLKIDFSQSRLFNVYANDVLIKPNAFDSTTNQLTPIKKTQCGENIYFRQTYIYEFYLTFGCTVKFVGQNFVEAMVRLQISYSDFFSTIGTSTFIDRFASVLGITQDTIKIVGVYEGSTVIYFGVTSPSGTSSANEVKALAEINDKINYQCTNGNLNLGSSVLACSSMVINSSGQVTTTSSGNYKKKEINYAVYIVLAFACLATAVAILMGIIKAFRISKAYKEIANLDTSEHEKADGQKGDFAENYVESKIEKV